MLGLRDSTNVPGTDPLCWKLIYRELSEGFENPGTTPEGAIVRIRSYKMFWASF